MDKMTPLSRVALLVAAGIPATGAAATHTVNTAVDQLDVPAGAELSLREAIRDAASGDEIRFDAALDGETIELVHGALVISGKNLEINAGSLPRGLRIDAMRLGRAFKIDASNCQLYALEITRGYSLSAGGAV